MVCTTYCIKFAYYEVYYEHNFGRARHDQYNNTTFLYILVDEEGNLSAILGKLNDTYKCIYCHY